MRIFGSISKRHEALGRVAVEAFADGVAAAETEALVRRIVDAAGHWVDRIRDHPNLWADDDDFELINAVEDARAARGVPRKWTMS